MLEETEEVKRAKELEVEAIRAAEGGSLGDALELLNRAIDEAPDYASPYNNRAQVRVKMALSFPYPFIYGPVLSLSSHMISPSSHMISLSSHMISLSSCMISPSSHMISPSSHMISLSSHMISPQVT